MITCLFASQPNQFDSSLFSATVSSGGSTTIATNHYYWIQGLSRGGLNLQTSLGRKAVDIGQKLTISLVSALPDGCDTFGLVVSASEDNDPENARILGIIWVKDKNQETNRVLPVSLVFSKDTHFTIDGTTANTGNLASLDAVNGMIRYVTGSSLFYLYDAEGWLPESQNAIGWLPLTASEGGTATRGNQCYLESTKTPRPNGYLYGGCDCPISSLVENSVIKIPYGWESGTDTLPIKVWILNENNPVSGGKLVFVPKLDNDSTQDLSQLIQITPTNQIDYATGIIDSALTNVPLVYSKGTPFYTLTSVLGIDKVLEFTIVASAVIGNGQSIDFNIIYSGNTGTLIENSAFGSGILSENTVNPNQSKFLRALPALIEVGAGVLQIPSSTQAYYFSHIVTQLYNGLTVNTADQIVAVNAQQNGVCRVIQSAGDLLNTEGIRAIISTEGGVYKASEWSNSISVTFNSQITLSFNQPTAIREDYPDVIAGMSSAFLVDEYIIQLELDGTSYYFSNITPVTSPETIILDSISGVSMTPPTINTDPDFGFFEITNLTISEDLGQGVLPATTTARVRVYQKYVGASSTLSKISHSTSDGCIPEFNKSFAEISALSGKVQVTANDTNGNYLNSKIVDSSEIIKTLGNSGGNEVLSFTPVYFRSPVATKTALKALNVADLTEGEVRVCLQNNSLYIYVLTLPSADDGENYLKSDDGTTEGWVKVSGNGGSGGGGLTQTASISSLKAITNGTVSNSQLFQVTGTGGIYQRFNGRTTAETLPFIVRPNDYNSVNAVYIRLNVIDENGNFLVTSDSITEGSGKLFLTPAERAKLGNLATDPNGTYATKTTTITGTNGLTGGGNLSENRTLSLNISGLPELTSPAVDDTLLLHDTSASAHKKIQVGNLGIQGDNIWIQTSTSIDFSSTIFPVQLTITNGNNRPFIQNQYVYLSDVSGTYKATFKVTAKSGTNLITIDKDLTKYVYPSSGVLSNGILVPTGEKGDPGDPGAPGSLSEFARSDTPNTPSTGNAALRVKSTEEKAYIDLPSTQKEITFFDRVKDAVLTGFSLVGVAAEAITNQDTIIQALQKIQKNINDIWSRLSGQRETLTTDRIYYVRTNGNDSNNGLTNTSEGAFLTPQKGIDVLATLDGGSFKGIVQIADGTYTTPIIAKNCIGFESITIQGNNSTPSNVTISTTGANAFTADSILTTKYIIKNLSVTTATSGSGLTVINKSVVDFSNINFGTTAGGHIVISGDAVVRAVGNYSISGGTGGASRHVAVYSPGMFVGEGRTITITGTPAFDYFVLATRMSFVNMASMTFTGSCTGQKYYVDQNSVLYVNSAGENYLPGNSAGTKASGGQYV